MAHFLIRMSCEASHTIEADSIHQAAKIGERLDLACWDSVNWSPVEVENAEEGTEVKTCQRP